MSQFDMPLSELESYRPERVEPPDFDSFWKATLTSSRSRPISLIARPIVTGLKIIETFDVSFAGYAGQPIKAWLMLPRDRQARLPVVVQYVGYGGGRGFPFHWLLWPAAGFATLVMDTR
jgi:cephalosporin-C deacetylase